MGFELTNSMPRSRLGTPRRRSKGFLKIRHWPWQRMTPLPADQLRATVIARVARLGHLRLNQSLAKGNYSGFGTRRSAQRCRLTRLSHGTGSAPSGHNVSHINIEGR